MVACLDTLTYAELKTVRTERNARNVTSTQEWKERFWGRDTLNLLH